MSNVQSYNALIDRFKAFASGHFILKRFSHGQIEVSDLEKFGEYPFMHVIPSNVTYSQGMKTFSFQIVLADLPRDKEDKSEYQREALSDLQRIAEDLIAEITNHRVLFGDLITVNNVSLEPFLEEFQHTLTGWTISLDLLVPYYWDACSIPAEWNDFFESSTGGTGSILSFVDSITRDENGNVSLVNDEATPAPNYYYGTNDEGVRGWYLLTDEVGLTCATIGTCQTIIDIESAIDDLQTEILLKANTADISAVGFSNDYNDLSNLPTIPAAQVNSDWNATSGVAEILNKPSLPATVGDMLKSVYDTDVDGVVDSAERIQIVVRNSTGSTLTKGQIVYLSGATGNRPNAVLAQANTEATSSKTIGMVMANIANNADGQIAVNGTLHDLDTSAFTAGDTLWLSATTAGGMVANTPPIEPNHTVFIGYVARSHPNLGRIVLAIQNGYELDELHGVLITSPANNEVLTYESSTSLWKNKTVETALGYTPVPTTRTLTINGTTQDLSANRTFTIATNAGTVTSVAALTLGTTGTDLTSTVANSTSTPVITLNVPTASATNRGALSSTDWSTFNGKFTLPSLTSGSVLFSNGTTISQDNANLFYDDTNNRLGIGTASPAFGLDVNGTARIVGQLTVSAGIVPSISGGGSLGTGSLPFLNGLFAGIVYSNTFQNYSSNINFSMSGTTVARIFTTTGNLTLQNGGTFTDAGFKLDVNGTARVSGTTTITPATLTGSAATSALDIAQTWNTTGTPIALKVNITDTASAAPSDLMSLQVGGVARFRVLKSGYFVHSAGGEMNGALIVGSNTISASSQLEVTSTTRGFLPPRMTTTQKNAIASPASGLVVYDTTLGKLCVRGAAAWETITSI
jgi:hypothetical protein